MERITIALLGAWHVHTPMFVSAVKNEFGDRAVFKTVWEDNAERGKKVAEKLGAAYVEDLDSVISDNDIDLFMIEAETCKHRALIEKAAKTGKAIYTDKVLAMNIEDGLAIKRTIEENGNEFCVSHESLPVGSYQYARKLLADGVLGDVVAINFRRAHGMAKFNYLPSDWFTPSVAGGGALIDLGVHGLSMLPYFAGTPVLVSAATHNFTGKPSEDSATIMVEFENGAIGTAHTDMVTSIMENSFEIIGTEGVLVVLGAHNEKHVYLNSQKMAGYEKGMIEVSPDVFGEDGLPPICWFINKLLSGDKGNTMYGLDIDMGLTVTRLAEAAYESARTGKKVPFNKQW